MALNLNGSSKNVTCGTAGGSLNITGALTVMARVNIHSFAAFQEIVCKYETDNASFIRGYLLQITSAANVVGYAAKTGFGDRYYRIGNTTLSTGTWYHLAYTFTPSDAIRIYVNGVEESSYTTSGSAPNAIGSSASTPLYLGRFDINSVPQRYMNGIIADARVYNVALTAGEIACIAAAKGGDSIVRGLISRWQCLGTDGVAASGSGTVIDIGPGTNHGTPANSPVYTQAPFKTRRG